MGSSYLELSGVPRPGCLFPSQNYGGGARPFFYSKKFYGLTWVKCGSGWGKTAAISTSKTALMETPPWSVLVGGGTWESFPSFWEGMLMWISKTRWGRDHGNAFPLGLVEAVGVVCLLFAVLNINKKFFGLTLERLTLTEATLSG